MLAVNKIDLIGFDQAVLRQDRRRFFKLRGAAWIQVDHADPDLGARMATMSSRKSANTPWYQGPALLDYLETIDVEEDHERQAVSLAGAMGQPAASRFSRLCGHDRERDDPAGRRDRRSRPSGKRSQVARIVTADGDLDERSAGDAVTLTLADELDIARGDMFGDRDKPARRSPTSSPRISSG